MTNYYKYKMFNLYNKKTKSNLSNNSIMKKNE